MTAQPESPPTAPTEPGSTTEDRPAGVVVVIAVAGFLLLGTRQSFTVPFTGLGLPLAQLTLLVIALLWVITRLFGQRGPAALGLLSAFLVIRVACTLVSYGLAAARTLSVEQRDSADRALLTEVVVTLGVVVLATVLRNRRDIELVLRGLLAGGAVSGLFALVQYVGGPDIAEMLHPPGFTERQSVLVTELLREGLVRTQGAAAHPLELGAVSALLVPIGISVVIAARRRGTTAWTWVVLTALAAAGGVVSLSRSTFLGIAAGVLIMALRWPLRRVGNVIAVVVAAVLVAGVALPNLTTALGQVFTEGSDDYSLQSRADGRSYVWAHFADHFWFGQGPGTYDLSTQQILDNQYLSQLMETGVVGLVMLAAVLLCAFGYAWRSGRGDDPVLRELGTGVAGALAALVVVSFVIDTGGFTQLFTLIWLLIGVAAALWRTTTGGVRPVAAPAR